jgi:hypothetical protein
MLLKQEVGYSRHASNFQKPAKTMFLRRQKFVEFLSGLNSNPREKQVFRCGRKKSKQIQFLIQYEF